MISNHKTEPSARVVTASQPLVDALLSMNTDNRKMREGIICVYMREIEQGEFVLTNQGVGVDCDGILTDGQHRLEAIKRCGYPPVQFVLVEGLSKKAKEKVDQHAKRSSRDMFKMFTENKDVCNLAPAICRMLLRDEKHAGFKPTFTEIYEKYEELETEIKSVLSAERGDRFFAAAHMAAFVWCVNKFPDKKESIIEMHDRAVIGANLDRSEPAFLLRNFCLTHRGASAGTQVQWERFYKTLKAIYTHIEGQTLGVLRATDPR